VSSPHWRGWLGVAPTQQASPSGALRITHQAQDFERVADVDGDDALGHLELGALRRRFVEPLLPRVGNHARQFGEGVAGIGLGQRCGDDRFDQVVVRSMPDELSDESERGLVRVRAAEQLRRDSLVKTSRMRPIETAV
jgi:hypothetical protein